MESTLAKLLEIIQQQDAEIKRQAAEIAELRQRDLSRSIKDVILPLSLPVPPQVPPQTQLQTQLQPQTQTQTQTQLQTKYPVFKKGGEITKAKFIDTVHECLYGLKPLRGQKEVLFSTYFADVKNYFPGIYLHNNKIHGISC